MTFELVRNLLALSYHLFPIAFWQKPETGIANLLNFSCYFRKINCSKTTP